MVALCHMTDSQVGREQNVPSKPFVSKLKLCKASWKIDGSLKYNKLIAIAGGQHQYFPLNPGKTFAVLCSPKPGSV